MNVSGAPRFAAVILEMNYSMAKVLIPTPLRQFAGQQNSVELSGGTVREVLDALTTKHLELRRHL
ncbi:MAG: hypothetical protein ACRD9L_14915, partial [Bryobacteraceae bacterium]